MATEYTVLYTKSGPKKRKTYADGILKVFSKVGSNSSMILEDVDGKVVGRGQCTSSMICRPNTTVTYFGYEIQIEEALTAPKLDTSAESSDILVTKENSANHLPCSVSIQPRFLPPNAAPKRFPQLLATAPESRNVPDYGSFNKFQPPRSQTSATSVRGEFMTVATPSSGPVSARVAPFQPMRPTLIQLTGGPKESNAGPAPVSIDPSLERLLRPHQVAGAKFLINRLSGGPFSEGVAVCAGGCVTTTLPAPETITGAILADEMGLGKTVVALTCMWSFLRAARGRGGCRAVIVCPSSLVQNWCDEVRKWFGVKLKPLVVIAGAKLQTKRGKKHGSEISPALASEAETTINAFHHSHPSTNPVLIISYESFLKHHGRINEAPGLDVLICDEGHRLKNILGTKTQTVLQQCRARKRVLLTGTPIQNDLEELFALVDFVNPGYLGGFASFKAALSQPIVRLKELLNERKPVNIDKFCAEVSPYDPDYFTVQDGLEATRQLQRLLSHVLLQRTQDAVLKALLPRRLDYVMLCNMTPAQHALYEAGVERMISDLSETGKYLGDVGDEAQRVTGRKRDSSALGGTNDLQDSEDSEEEEEEEEEEEIAPIDLCGPDKSACASVPFDYDPVLEEKPQQNYVAESGGGGVLGELQRLRRVCNAASPGQDCAGPEAQLAGSCKLQVVDMLLQAALEVAGPNAPAPKVVIVSSFTHMLDLVAKLVAWRQYGECLRIDGKTAVDKRQDLVDCFNRASNSKANVFLLSAKAGGVGLNLVGGHRLIMLDCDWNPAVDKQAMSRIWRDGQSSVCHVYRLVTNDTVEQSIFQRQSSKFDLCSAIDSDSAGPPSESGGVADSEDCRYILTSTVAPPDVTRLSLGRVGVTRIVRPSEPVFKGTGSCSTHISGNGAAWANVRLLLREGDADIDPVLLHALGSSGIAGASCVHTIAQV